MVIFPLSWIHNQTDRQQQGKCGWTFPCSVDFLLQSLSEVGQMRVDLAVFFSLKLSVCFVVQEPSHPLQLKLQRSYVHHLVFQLDHWPDSKSYANSEGVRKGLSPSGTRFLGRIPHSSSLHILWHFSQLFNLNKIQKKNTYVSSNGTFVESILQDFFLALHT